MASTLNFAIPHLPRQTTPDPAVQELYLQALLETNVPPKHPHADAVAAQRLRVMQRYRTVLEHAPDFAPAHAGLAFVLSREGDFDGALEAASRALALDSTQTLARMALSATLGYHLWRWAEAERVLSRGIELAPSSPHLYLARANTRFVYWHGNTALGQHEPMLQCLEAMVEQRFRFIAFVLRRAEVDGLRSNPRFQLLMRRVFPDG